MAETQKNEVRTLKRMERRTEVRQALFIKDFVESKYPEIFKEAAALHNELNASYPRKPDLRRCPEYKCWKNSTPGKQGKTKVKTRARKPYKYCIFPYGNINTQEQIKEQPQKVMQLNIELMPVPNDNQQETVIQEHNPPATPHQSDPPSTPEEQSAEAPIEPYNPLDEIPPDLVEKIITELRLDPQLSAIMDDVQTEMQESLELNVPELEIDIPELDQIFDQDAIFW